MREKMKTWKQLEEKHPELLTLKKSRVWPMPDIGEGWHDLIDELMCAMKKKGYIGEDFKVVQVKEKFGGLRFYVDGLESMEAHSHLMDLADKSFKICEKCGKVGKLRDGRMWVKTLCDECNKKREVENETN